VKFRRRWAAILAAVFALAVPGAASAITYAPVDTPGPALSVPEAQLDASIECDGAVDNATVTPVLLVPATGVNPHENYFWNWEPALTSLGIPWCAVTLPGHSLGDIQVAGEYVVNAIRTMFHRAGRPISIMGHSQGGMVPRWALRFWPDTRAMVDDQIGFAGSNHGSAADPTCATGCSPAFQQQHAGSEFLKALNSGQETFPGISYTEIYTHNDEVVTPNADDSGSSSLHGGGGMITNVAIQDACPADTNEHLRVGTVDPAAYALAIDALSHPGPATDPAAPFAATECPPLKPFMPGVNPATEAADEIGAGVALFTNIGAYPPVQSEPPLKCYVTASCASQVPGAASADAVYSPILKQKCRKKRKRHKSHRRKRCHRKHRKKGHR